jgi:signal transduction histidine kinase
MLDAVRQPPLSQNAAALVLEAWTDRFLYPACHADPELGRRARMIAAFSLLGFVFGAAYAGFYLLIGHYWGAGIIIGCSLAFAAVPFLVRPARSVRLPGNLILTVLTGEFIALCLVEGGIYGHAIAWLVSVPVCALLLADRRVAARWLVVCLLAGLGFIAAQLAGVELRPAYDETWHALVTGAGYVGLILFMFTLGVIFELGRERALQRLKEAQAKLEASNERLTHLNREKDEFLGIAAHDLKNPLTAIILNAELVAMVRDQEQVARLAAKIMSAGTRMRDLIGSLLDAHAIEQGEFTSHVERCDLNDLVTQSLENNEANAVRKNIRLEYPPTTDVWAVADRRAVLQILDNLLSNAVKYTPPGTTVHIRARRAERDVLVSFQDEGPGISAEDQRRLFQRFARLTAQPTGGESSTGLGLSIVHRLARAMGGDVSCVSAPGQHATFTLRLPAWQPGGSAPVNGA